MEPEAGALPARRARRRSANLQTFYHRLARANPDVVKKEVFGHSLLGQPIRRLQGHRRTRARAPTAPSPPSLRRRTQHAREWIATEVERRLFHYVARARERPRAGHPGAAQDSASCGSSRSSTSTATTTRSSARARACGARTCATTTATADHRPATASTPTATAPRSGATTRRARPTTSPARPTAAPRPASEPEVQPLRRAERRIKPEVPDRLPLLRPADPLPRGLAGRDARTDTPLIDGARRRRRPPGDHGLRPRRRRPSSTRPTATSPTTPTTLRHRWPTPSSSTAAPAARTSAAPSTDPNPFTPGRLRLPGLRGRRPGRVPEEPRRSRSTSRARPSDPDRPVSHLGNTAPDFVPDARSRSPTATRRPSRSTPTARSAPSTVHWQVNDGAVRSARTTSEYQGGERYGDAGRLLPPLRGAGHRAPSPATRCEVWFTARRPGTVGVVHVHGEVNERRRRCSLMVAEDYTGRSVARAPAPTPGPQYLQLLHATRCRTRASATTSTTSTRRAAPRPTTLGVLCHYKAVVWDTGDDLYVAPASPAASPAAPAPSKLARRRDPRRPRLHERGGKAPGRRPVRAPGRVGPVPLQPARRDPPNPFCNVQPDRRARATRTTRPGQTFNCVAIVERLPAVLARGLPADHAQRPTPTRSRRCRSRGRGAFGHAARSRSTAPTRRDNQDNVYSFLTTSSILPPSDVPAVHEPTRSIKLDRPPAFDPPTGTQYAYAQSSELDATSGCAARSTSPAATAASLKFKLSYDTEPDFDYVFVEAHTVGQDDWTTLPDVNGHTSQDIGAGCPTSTRSGSTSNPFLRHYITRTGDPGGVRRARRPARPASGTRRPATRAASRTGRSTCRAYAGKQVEVSITYVDRPGVARASARSSTTPGHRRRARAPRPRSRTASAAGRWPARRPTADANGADWIRSRRRRLRRRPGRRHRRTRSTWASASRA